MADDDDTESSEEEEPTEEESSEEESSSDEESSDEDGAEDGAEDVEADSTSEEEETDEEPEPDEEPDDEPESNDADDDADDDEDEDDDVDDEVDDDESVLEGDDELDADEKAMLDSDIEDDDLDDDLDVDDEELDEDKPRTVTETEQRRAGWSCLFLLVAIPVSVWYGAKLWLASALEIDQTNVPEWYLAATADGAIALQDPDAAFIRPSIEVEWFTEIDGALEKAQEEEKPLVIAFVTDNEECERMTNGTWLNTNVAHLLQDVVPVRLDLGDETTTLAERFSVTSAPTTLFLTPDLERLRPDTARLVDASDMEIYLYETLENLEEQRIYREGEQSPLDSPDDEPDDAPDEAPSE